MSISISSAIVYFIGICIMSNSKIQMVCILVLLDNIFLGYTVAIVGVIGVVIIS